jgi:hypothetical protein
MPVTQLEKNGQTTLYSITDVVEASTPFNYILSLDPGSYRIAMFVKSSLTGVTTTIQAFPFVDKAQSIVGLAFVWGPNDTQAVTLTPTLPAALNGRMWTMIAGALNTPVTFGDSVVNLPYGLRFQVAKGTAVTGERLEIVVAVVRVDKTSVEAFMVPPE